MADILEQLRNYCKCNDDVTENDVAEAIDLISMYTGWTNVLCETFLMSDRREVVELPSCHPCVYLFEPYYYPFDEDSFEFKVVKQDGMEETEIECDYVYSETDGNFRVDLGLPSCNCGCSKCGCEPTYKLVVEYAAGYEEIPECLLPVMCNLLEVIKAKNNCDCSSCGCENGEQTVTYASGDITSVTLETDLAATIIEQYKRQIAMMSIRREIPKTWGDVL